MNILHICDNVDILEIMKIVKLVINIIKIVAPIALIVSGMILFAKDTVSDNPDASKSLNILSKRVIASVLIFLIPTIVNILCNIVGSDNVNLATCISNANTTKINAIRSERANNSIDTYKETKSDGDYVNASNYIQKIKDIDEKNRLTEELNELKKKYDKEKKISESAFGVNSHNWGWINNTLVHFDSDNNIMKNTTFTVSGVSYKVDNNGKVLPNVNNPFETNAYDKQTNAIVNAHRYDFDVNTFDRVISSYGGYENYVRSLGGVFTKYAGVRRANITTKKEFLEVARYVWGLMNMYGVEYSNASSSNNHKNWGGKNNMTSDAFYYPKKKDKSYMNKIHSMSNATSSTTNKTASFSIDDVLSGNGNGMSIQCTGGITFLFKKAGLIPQNAPTIENEFYGKNGPSSGNKYYRNRGAKLTKEMSVKDLQVGDVIGFYEKKYKDYYHVAVVADVTDSQIIIYDSGSKFTNNRSGVVVLDKNSSLSKKYGYYTYYVLRLPLNLQ